MEFNPRLHFIDEEGHLKIPDSFAPFGFGRRICLGEQLARNDMFLIAARLLQKVRFEPLDGEHYTLDYNPNIDFHMKPMPFAVRITPRQ